MSDFPNRALSPEAKNRILAKIEERRSSGAAAEPTASSTPGSPDDRALPKDSSNYVFSEFWEYKKLQLHREVAERVGVDNPFFRPQAGLAADEVNIDGQDVINFSSYNYIGLCGDPRVNAAAMEAMERYGTSAGASRVVSGEKPVHRALEGRIAEMLGVDDAVVMVSGHATNVTAISCLMGPKDLIVYDRWAHNSILEGAAASGAKLMMFPHNDCDALDDILMRFRGEYERTLIAVEGIYSMDGDIAPMERLIETKKRHRALLLVDEAHSIGVIGRHGGGVREHFDLDGVDVDIWMGTLSKSLAGCGGYIAGDAALIELLKYTAPGFVYSVGMSPVMAAASLRALELMFEEPWRVARLNNNAKTFRDMASRHGLDVGLSEGKNIVPIIVGASVKAGRLAGALFDAGINVHPIIYPAVQENAARLRFFLSSMHSPEQVETAVMSLVETQAAIETISDG